MSVTTLPVAIRANGNNSEPIDSLSATEAEYLRQVLLSEFVRASKDIVEHNTRNPVFQNTTIAPQEKLADCKDLLNYRSMLFQLINRLDGSPYSMSGSSFIEIGGVPISPGQQATILSALESIELNGSYVDMGRGLSTRFQLVLIKQLNEFVNKAK